jgi:hypothetical protein
VANANSTAAIKHAANAGEYARVALCTFIRFLH